MEITKDNFEIMQDRIIEDIKNVINFINNIIN